MNWQEFTALLVLATAMSFSPGPNTALSTALAANHGLRRAMPFVCAVPVGWGVLLSLCAFGLGALLLAIPLLGVAIKWI
ncbi:MAG: LysE family transporter, partial [Polaromonas sp.]|nr:LysE family transporter [Polaromonas sp.]